MDTLFNCSIYFYDESRLPGRALNLFMTHTCYLKAVAKWVSDGITGVFILLLKQTVWLKFWLDLKHVKKKKRKKKVSLFLNTCQDLLTNNWSLGAVDARIESYCRHSWHSASACVFFRSWSEAMKCPPAETRAESTWNGECLSYKETRNLVRPVPDLHAHTANPHPSSVHASG